MLFMIYLYSIFNIYIPWCHALMDASKLLDMTLRYVYIKNIFDASNYHDRTKRGLSSL